MRVLLPLWPSRSPLFTCQSFMTKERKPIGEGRLSWESEEQGSVWKTREKGSAAEAQDSWQGPEGGRERGSETVARRVAFRFS